MRSCDWRTRVIIINISVALFDPLMLFYPLRPRWPLQFLLRRFTNFDPHRELQQPDLSNVGILPAFFYEHVVLSE